jgi:hypothetical protein
MLAVDSTASLAALGNAIGALRLVRDSFDRPLIREA